MYDLEGESTQKEEPNEKEGPEKDSSAELDHSSTGMLNHFVAILSTQTERPATESISP